MSPLTTTFIAPVGVSVDPVALEELGKKAAHLADNGVHLTDAVVDTIGHMKLNQEQVERVVEFANIEAFNLKYAAANPSLRYPVIDGGPADARDVCQKLASFQKAAGLVIDEFEYAAPAPKISEIGFEVEVDPEFQKRASARQLLREVGRLKAAHDEVSQRAAAAEGMIEVGLEDLTEAFKLAFHGGATPGEIFAAWQREEPKVAGAVWKKLGLDPIEPQKVAGRRISPNHTVVQKFAALRDHLVSLATHQGALRSLESAIHRLEGE